MSFALYAATVVMSAGLAFMQPALPPLVRQWLPQRVSFATAVFTNGLLVGETLGGDADPVRVLPLADGSWRWRSPYGALPLVLFADPMSPLAFAPAARSRADASRSVEMRGRWPNWRNKQVWQCGVLFGSVNGIYLAPTRSCPVI